MKTNLSSNVMVRNGLENSFIQKVFIATLIAALLFASLPARAALAAPAGDGKNFNTNEMQQEWDNKLEKVENNGIFYQRVRVYPANFEDLDELAVAHGLLNEYGVALRAAQRLVISHAGFDEKGKVTNANLADQTLKDLSENLRLMRAYKEKLDHLEGEYILLPMSALTTTTPQ